MELTTICRNNCISTPKDQFKAIFYWFDDARPLKTSRLAYLLQQVSEDPNLNVLTYDRNADALVQKLKKHGMIESSVNRGCNRAYRWKPTERGLGWLCNYRLQDHGTD